jgi:hypothetical protein
MWGERIALWVKFNVDGPGTSRNLSHQSSLCELPSSPKGYAGQDAPARRRQERKAKALMLKIFFLAFLAISARKVPFTTLSKLMDPQRISHQHATTLTASPP